MENGRMTNPRLRLFCGTTMWLVAGATGVAAMGPVHGNRLAVAGDAVRQPPAIVLAQFHEPHEPMGGPVVTAPPAPPAPPKVFAPIKLPPKNQAIPSSKKKTVTKKTTTAPKSGTSSKTKGSKTKRSTKTTTKLTAAQRRDAAAAQAAAAERKKTVRSLQQGLADLGFEPGPVDGLPGKKTMNAVFTWIAAIADEGFANDARTAAHGGDYAALSAMLAAYRDQAAKATASAPMTLAVGGGAGAAPDGGTGNGGAGDGGAGDGGAGAPPVERDWHQPPVLRPDPEVERIMAEATKMKAAMEKLPETPEMPEIDAKAKDAISADFLDGLDQGGNGDDSLFMLGVTLNRRIADFEARRSQLAQSRFRIDTDLKELGDKISLYNDAIASEQVIADRSYTDATRRVEKSIANSQDYLSSTKKELVADQADYAHYLADGRYSERWMALIKGHVDADIQMIEDLKKQITHQKSEAFFDQTLGRVLIDYGGLTYPYSWGGSPLFNENGVMVGRDSDRLLKDVHIIYGNLDSERDMLSSFRKEAVKLKADIAAYRTAVAGLEAEQDEKLAAKEKQLDETLKKVDQDIDLVDAQPGPKRVDEPDDAQASDTVKADDQTPDSDKADDQTPGPDNAAGPDDRTDARDIADASQRVKQFDDVVDRVLSGDIDESAFASVNQSYNETYSNLEEAFAAEMLAHGWADAPAGATFMDYYESLIASGELSEEAVQFYSDKIAEGRAYLALAKKHADTLNAVATAHNEATAEIRERLTGRTDQTGPAYPEDVDSAEIERQTKVSQAQADVDHFIESGNQAKAELKSLLSRTDLPAEEKARVAADLQSRVEANEAFARDSAKKLAALGGEFDGYDGKNFSDFNPYKITQTDVELQKIAAKDKAAEQFYDEIKLARKTIRNETDGLDAANLQSRVTRVLDNVSDTEADLSKMADKLHKFSKGMKMTRSQGELERLQAEAYEGVTNAERNLAYAESVYRTSRNAEGLLLLGAAAAGVATGGAAVTMSQMAQGQAIMATLEGTNGAIQGVDQGDLREGLKRAGKEAGKYYLPINTYIAVKDKKATKLDVAFGVVSDAAILFTGYSAAKGQVRQFAAAEAKATRMGLTEGEKAVSNAARAAADKGDDLIRSYEKAKAAVSEARATGRTAAEIAEAESELSAAVKLIDTSDEAKLALKTRDAGVQAQFVDDQATLIKKPADAVWQQKMKSKGWSDEALKTKRIRNQSSGGSVGFDDDIALFEPSLLDKADDGVSFKYEGLSDPKFVQDTKTFRAKLTKDGTAASLTQWENDAKVAMDEAYKEVAGYSAEKARVEMTTGASEEAFKDIRVLEEGGVNAASAGWAEQSASVTQAKMRDGIAAAEKLDLSGGKPVANLPSGAVLEKATTDIKVASRELLKDLTKKALKAKPGTVIPPKIDRQIRILQYLVDGVYDPAVANRRLIETTGTTLTKTLESLGGHFEVLLKF